MIVRGGVGLRVSEYGQAFTVPNGEWAVMFDDVTEVGEVEYIDARLNETIDAATFASRYQYLVDHYDAAQAEKDRREAEAAAQEGGQ